jgi:stearoyl-CoA desaturase (delta-9 desaturase)
MRLRNRTAPAASTGIRAALLAWVDNQAMTAGDGDNERIDWLRVVPYLLLHLSVLAVFWVGVSRAALATAIALYALRMFAITGFYHRYFSHKAFRTSRAAQFVFAVLGASAVQRGPLWWAAHHRHHHVHSDEESDPHSPHRHGFLWAHTGWFMSRRNFATRDKLIKDLMRYPELRLLDRFDVLAPIALAAGLYGLGEWLGAAYAGAGTSGPQLLVWGFCISTVALYHATFSVNSLTHTLGRRRYPTRDSSRNNWLIALITFGEGWHNNHHHYPGAACQGFCWWEIDVTYYVLRLLGALGLVWDLRVVPGAIRNAGSIE